MKTFTLLKGTRGQRQRQRGAVAIMFGLSLLVLFGFMALVFDLGRTYVVRTELQNAADAAALAGAKDLNQKLEGVTKAIDTAKKIGLQNNTTFSFKGNAGIAITDAMIWVGSCPDDGCMVLASSVGSDALAADKTFLKVEIPSGGLATFFAVVPTTVAGTGTPSTSTYGRAVAGRFITDVTPIGVCALDLNKGGTKPTTPPGADEELTEFGFRRGVSYNTFDLNSISGGASDTYLLDPIGPYSSPCVPNNSNAINTTQFVCSGSSATITATPTMVWGNTGIQAMPTQRALNSRFGDNPPAQCIASPPDTNVRDYPCTSSSCPKGSPINTAALPNTWMDPSTTTTPNVRQTMNLAAVAAGTATKEDYGVLWSYSRAMIAVGTSPNATPGDRTFSPADWPKLYPATDGPLNAETSYPGGLSGIAGSPYSEPSSSSYFRSGGTGAVPKRRVLNLVIANCTTPIGNGTCLPIPVVGIGRFFMQVPANISGSRELYVEFGGLVEPIPDSVIRLYR